MEIRFIKSIKQIIYDLLNWKVIICWAQNSLLRTFFLLRLHSFRIFIRWNSTTFIFLIWRFRWVKLFDTGTLSWWFILVLILLISLIWFVFRLGFIFIFQFLLLDYFSWNSILGFLLLWFWLTSFSSYYVCHLYWLKFSNWRRWNMNR